MEISPEAKDANAVKPEKKSWKDYIRWAGFIVTIGVLLHKIYSHGVWVVYYIFGEGRQVFGHIGDPQYSTLFKATSTFGMLDMLVFFALSAVILALLAFRKKIVPKLLVIFTSAAIFFTVALEVLYFLLAAEFKEMASLRLNTVVFVAIDIVLLVYYIKSAGFKAIFNK
jgi:hypothetical protein